jgi:ferredoxin
LIRVSVDESRCEGHGLCEAAAPGVFELGDDGFAAVLLDPVPDDLIGQAEAGVRLCPVAALTIQGPGGDSAE